MKLNRLLAFNMIGLLMVGMIGCFTPSQIHEGFTLAEAGLNSTVRILTPTNPAFAAKVALIEPFIKAADSAMTIYFSGPNATNADKAQSALAALSSALDDLYTQAHVDPAILATVEGVIAIVNTWLIVSQGHLPPVPPTASAQARVSGGRTLPTVPGAKSAKDLRKHFNSHMVAAGHPEGTI